jgi:uncharacterized protein (TIGR03083 family)
MTTAVDVAAELAAELAELADLLESLPPDRWDAASLCDGWRIREVVAHVTLPTYRSAPAVAVQLVRAGFRWNTVADRLARRDAERSVAELVAALRSARMRAWRPPGGGAEGALTHAVVHGLDATVPLGVPRHLDPARARAVLDTLVAPRSLQHFGVDVSAVELRADDVEWTHGSGPPLHADARTLILGLTGRRPLPSGQSAAAWRGESRSR